MKIQNFSLVLLMLVIVSAAGCATAPTTEAKRLALQDQSAETIRTMKANDPDMSRFFDSAHAYAVFPSVGRGGAGVGGAYGRGIVYQNGQPVGYCDLSQGTIGFQLGGQAFSQVIFFETRDAFERFKTGNFAFAAQATAVAAKHGASADADYERGVAVFTMTRGGLMYEAAIGGQKFSYEPL